MSSHLQWLVIRNNSSFLLKGAHGQTFSTEPRNLKGKNSFRFNGLIHKKAVGIELTDDNKGLVLSTKKQTGRNRPAKSINRVTFKANTKRTTLNKIRKTLRSTHYRNDLKVTALRKASALLRGQKAKPAAAAAGATSAAADKKAKKAK